MAGMLRSRAVRRLLFFVVLWGFVGLALLYFINYNLDVAGTRFGHFVGSHLALQSIGERNDNPNRFIHLEPNIDKSPIRSQDEIIEHVQRQNPNLPIVFLNKRNNRGMYYKNESCAKVPNLLELQFNNIYWQVLQTTNGTFQLYGAYYDARQLSQIGPSIRILAMINRIKPTVKTYCQIWFDSLNEPAFVEVAEYKCMWFRVWGNYKQGVVYLPYLITCKIPSKYHKMVPTSVSVVENPCDKAKSNLKVIYNKPVVKKDFAVCVKGLDFLYEDYSVRLVEWIELLGVLGADKIFFYELQAHPNISKVLQYYEKLGRVDITPITLPGGQPNVPGFQHIYLVGKAVHKRQSELIPYNDCLYKNLYSYRYIILLDVDEVIMPINVDSWKELMDIVEVKAFGIKKMARASYHVSNVYFLDDLIHDHDWFEDIPRYMHMLQHVYRSKNFTRPGSYVKSFHNPERVLAVHNHFPLFCLGSTCSSYPIQTSDAQLQHYRANCTEKKACVNYRRNSVVDTTIWKFKNELIKRTTDTLFKIGFFNFK